MSASAAVSSLLPSTVVGMWERVNYHLLCDKMCKANQGSHCQDVFSDSGPSKLYTGLELDHRMPMAPWVCLHSYVHLSAFIFSVLEIELMTFVSSRILSPPPLFLF